ncbi:helix-turn-helix domain-containing protein [Oceanobacillus jeddahense]|uniref:Helix-turn-helix domain-containing protein n=1 Tax=Oceanobacillus jeddahense TaxID=1462527 RepID=A0ABY5JYW6_9BACI|nr:helix-turn-helix domain-containing protein [Oceanobacillus jeddahense]UUI05615.1 helix-turn-helix domain-containing protein [Oceanobacillus jeddahense]
MLTVKEFSEVFSKDNFKLIAGIEGKNNTIEYLNIQEIDRKSSWLRKHGLIMTTFKDFNSVDRILRQLEFYNDMNVSAVAMHLAMHKEVPKKIIEKADELGLPLITIPSNLPYYFIFEKVNKYIQSEADNLRKQVDEINDSMLRIVLEEKDAKEIIVMVGKFIKTPIYLLNDRMQMTNAWAGDKYSLSELRNLSNQMIDKDAELVKQCKLERKYKTTPVYFIGSKSIAFTVFPLINDKLFLGYLVVGISEKKYRHYEVLIKHAITALLLDGMRTNSIKQFIKNKDITLLEEVIHGHISNVNISEFTFPVSKVTQLMIIDTDVENIRNILFLLEDIFKEENQETFICILENQIIGLLTEGSSVDILCERILKNDVRIAFSGRLSSFSSRNLKRAYEQAKLVLKYMKTNSLSMVSWEKLRIDKIVYFLSEQPIFKEYEKSIIQPLLKNEEETTDLINTLYVYLESFFSLKLSSEKLYVHPNTVKYRLQKVKELLPNIDWNDIDTFMDILLALKLHKFNYED